jgi:hypothetical protein
MGDLAATLRDAFERADYDVDDVTVNRQQVRILLREAGAEADELREVTYGVVDEEDVLGLDVRSESVDGQPEVSTVVTFRTRGR